MRRSPAILALRFSMALGLALLACAETETGPSHGQGGGPDADAGADAADTAGAADSGRADRGDGDAVGPVGLDFGEQCRSNTDCESGFCVASPLGFVCTERCGTSACPSLDGVSLTCRVVTNFGADEVRICTPVTESICEPCLDDRNCFEGACVALASGSVCGLDCHEEADCPEGTFCFNRIPGVDLEVPQCLPDNLTCDCGAENAGSERPCARSSLDGARTCTGTERCDPALGWVGCDAPTPAQEVCDGVDNDCNGLADDGIAEVGDACEVSAEGLEETCPGILFCEGAGGMVCRGAPPEAERCDLRDNDCDGDVDEDFVDEVGRYAGDAACGVCGNDCTARFPDGWVAECQLLDDEPACVVVECPPGYVQIGLTACVPLESALCRACNRDSDCNDLVGDICVEYDDGNRFCGRDCSDTSSFGTGCPDGFTCDGELGQCVLTEGSCICDAGDHFTLACELVSSADPELVCNGRQECDDGVLSTCEPPLEACDEVDNNCDGVVDEGFLNPATRLYDGDEDCGRCFNDCTDRFLGEGLHASGGSCDSSTGDPTCRPDCVGDFVDADGLLFNGCECDYEGASDVPDPEGKDSNCDGIDGEVARGVFVSSAADAGLADGSRAFPFPSIGQGIAAAGEGKDHVYVEAGVYSESITLRPGISLFGGYAPGFGARGFDANPTAIIGQPGALATVSAVDVELETTFEGFVVVGANRTGAGESSYAVHVVDSSDALVVQHNEIRAGDGGSGANGGAGGTGASAGEDGGGFVEAQPGQPAVELVSFCSGSVAAGGAGAQFSCAAAGETDGGQGGDSDCPADTGHEDDGLPGSPSVGADGGLGGPGGYSTVWDYLTGNDTWVFATGCEEPTALWDDICQDHLANPANGYVTCQDGDCLLLGEIYATDCTTASQCAAALPEIAYCESADSTFCAYLGCCLENPAACDTYARRRSPNNPSANCSCLGCFVPDGAEETIDGLDGEDGTRGAGGAGGGGCNAGFGTVSGVEWEPDDSAGQGADGYPGSGGGGGGAGGGLAHHDVPSCANADFEMLGGGGGGGGAGGCGGLGGQGGGSAGGSFGVFLVFTGAPASLPVIQENTIYRGFGGPGGDGGPGGEGGLGSEGAVGLDAGLGCVGVGGTGGRGGPGGPGGGGGGGCGGPSAGIYVFGQGDHSTVSYRAQNHFPSSGAAGAAGRGGSSGGTEGDGDDAQGAVYEPVVPCDDVSADTPSCGG